MNFIRYYTCLLLSCYVLVGIQVKAQPVNNTDVPAMNNFTNPRYEVHLSIDETAPVNILLSTNTQAYFGQTLNPNQGVYSSTNSGTGFSGVNTFAGQGSSKGDPCTAWDANGNAYVTSLNYFYDGIKIIKSTDKCLTWTNPVTVCSKSFTGYCGNAPINNSIDKPWLTIDNAVNSPFLNNIYVTWTEFTTYTGDPNCTPSGSQDGFIAICKSDNGGSSFYNPIQVRNDHGLGHGSQVATGPKGEVYICWSEFGDPSSEPALNIGFAYSADACATFAINTKTAFSYTGINDPVLMGGEFNGVSINDHPSMAVDKSCADHSGRIYIAYPENIGAPFYMESVIKVKYSDNNGATWQSANSGNPINISAGYQNFFPAITVDNSTGIVSVAYYAFDNPTSSYETNTYVAYSSNGGQTFSNVKVSDVSHITAAIPGLTGYAGDYIGITAFNGKAYASWMDNRNGSTQNDWQVYVSKIDYGVTSTYSTVPYVLNVNGPITVNNGNFKTYRAVDKVVIPATSTFQSNPVSHINITACKEVNLANNFSGANELHAYIDCPADSCLLLGGGRYANGDVGGNEQTEEPKKPGASDQPSPSEMRLHIFPNPTFGIVQIAIQSPLDCDMVARISGVSGIEFASSTYPLKKGDNTLKLDLSDYTPGIYFITVLNRAGEIVKRSKIVLSK